MTIECRPEPLWDGVPEWVPPHAQRYLAHTETGVSIRALARESDCHASTILRQIRRVESRRDDPLIDEALVALRFQLSGGSAAQRISETLNMNAHNPGFPQELPCDDASLAKAAQDILLKLSASGAVLAMAKDMEKAVVVRDLASGETERSIVVDRPIAQAMALKDWIACKSHGRISRYAITAEGRAELSRMVAQAEISAQGVAQGFEDEQAAFSSSPKLKAQAARRMRFSSTESPLSVLARRRDKEGNLFLAPDLVAAGERLREDFELSQMQSAGMSQNWDRFLTAGTSHGATGGKDNLGPMDAKDRLQDALSILGEGLADIALRCCCYMEGLEVSEKRLGWPARSGKVVLRIALIRLREHYSANRNDVSELIG